MRINLHALTAGVAAAAVATLLTLAAGDAAGAAPAITHTDGCSAIHGPGFCGTWKDVDKGTYVAAVGTPKQPNASTFTFFGFRDTNAPAADTSFYAFHPAQFAADNGAVLQFSNAGRSEVPPKYLAADAAGHPFWAALISPADEWIYDGVGFVNGASGQYLVIGPHGLRTSANPADESVTEFVLAS